MPVMRAFASRLVVGTSLGSCVLALIGCAAPLLHEISQAQDAINTAQAAKADQYASDLLVDAKTSLNEAMLLPGGQQQDAKELLLRAQLQADLATAVTKERAIAVQLQAERDRREAAKTAAAAAEQAAQAAKAELEKPVILP
jgi:Domain of unknown function (DUF4398)